MKPGTYQRVLVSEFVLIDSATTYYALRVLGGIREANPYMLELMKSTSIAEAVLVSAAVKSAAILILTEMARYDFDTQAYNKFQRALLEPTLIIMVIAGAWLCVNNLYLVAKGMG